MVETGDQTKMLNYADFSGLLRRKSWCCQTGLNCRPLHYQWSARALEIPCTDNHLSGFRSNACDTFVPVGQAFGPRAFGRIDLHWCLVKFRIGGSRFHYRTLSQDGG
jgi:hypothetical protein